MLLRSSSPVDEAADPAKVRRAVLDRPVRHAAAAIIARGGRPRELPDVCGTARFDADVLQRSIFRHLYLDSPTPPGYLRALDVDSCTALPGNPR